MGDPTEELLKEIAAKHGIALTRDDPLMMFLTMQEHLQRQALEAHGRVLDDAKSEIEGITARWSLETTTKAERVLNAALTASRELMQEAAVNAASVAAVAIRKENERAAAAIDGRLAGAQWIAYANIAAGLLSLAAVCVAVVFFR